MNNDQLGRLAQGGERRDAVHIAIVPVEAGETLHPGQHVGVIDGKAMATGFDRFSTIAIVDPFLRDVVAVGKKCFVCLYPNSITSLRHEWVHPAFGQQDPMDELRVAAEMVANICGKTYDALMDDATQFQQSFEYGEWGDYIMDNSERYKNVTEADWEKFWQHWERTTGRKGKEGNRWAPFTCSC